MDEENFQQWLRESVNAYQGMTQSQQCQALCKLVESVEPEVKYRLSHELMALLQKDILVALPRELQEIICNYLDTKSLVNACKVSREWKRLITSHNAVWQRKCTVLGVALPHEKVEMDWKGMCIRALKMYQNLKCGTAFQNQSIQSINVPVTTLTYSEGYLAASNTKAVLMWDLKPLRSGASAKFLQELIETPTGITSMKLCMAKGMLVCGYGTGKIEILEVRLFKHTAEGRVIHELLAHSECILSLSVCKDHDLFASGSSDQKAKLWQLSSGTLLHTFPIHPHWVIHVSLSFHEPENMIMLTHTQKCLQVFSWPVSTGPSSMTHKAFQYKFPQPLITTPGCQVRGSTLYFVEQCWPSQTPHMAYLAMQEMEDEVQMIMIPIMRKVRKLLSVGKRFALLLTATSCRLQPELVVIDLKTREVVAGYSVPHSSSSSPDQSQIVVGDCSWLDGLGGQEPGDLVVAVALKGGDIHAVTWKDLQTVTG